MRRCAIIALVLLSAIVHCQDLVIVGGRVEVGNGKVLENGVIVVRDGKIAEIGSKLPVPVGMKSLDAKGMTIYPGFINGYSTKSLKLPDAPSAATPPSTLSVAPPTMWQGNRKGIRAQLKTAECLDLKVFMSDAHKAGFTASYLAPGGGLIRGTGALAYWTDEKFDAHPFGMEMSFRNAGGQGYPGTLLGAVALLRQTLYDAQRYGKLSKPEKDADYDGLQPVLRAETSAVFAADSEADIQRALKIGDEFGFPVVIQGSRDAYKRGKMLADKKVPVIVDCAIGDEPSVKTSPDGPPVAVLEERRDQWKERALNVIELQKAGVLFAFSAERDGWSDYLKDVRALIGLGLSKSAALRAMTSAPAEIFGVAREVGTLEKGKVANLVLMNGDFADAKSEVQSVVVLGKVFEYKKEAK